MTPKQIKRVCEIQWKNRRVADPLSTTGWMLCTFFPHWISELIKWPTWKKREDNMPDQGELMLILCGLVFLKLLIDTAMSV